MLIVVSVPWCAACADDKPEGLCQGRAGCGKKFWVRKLGSFRIGIMPCEAQRKFGKYRLICLYDVLQIGGMVSSKPAAKYVFSRPIGLLNRVA